MKPFLCRKKSISDKCDSKNKMEISSEGEVRRVGMHDLAVKIIQILINEYVIN